MLVCGNINIVGFVRTVGGSTIAYNGILALLIVACLLSTLQVNPLSAIGVFICLTNTSIQREGRIYIYAYRTYVTPSREADPAIAVIVVIIKGRTLDIAEINLKENYSCPSFI